MIVKIPHPALTSTAKKVDKIDRKVKNVIDKLIKELTDARNPKGVGLAAPQIGISLQIFITRPSEKSPIRVFINPHILKRSQKLSEIRRTDDSKVDAQIKEKKLEGCLSIPNVWGYLKRSKSVILRFTDIEGNIKEEIFRGFMAAIVQHETDHLQGILFTQRVLEQNQKLYRIENRGLEEEKLVEIEI